MSLDLPQLDQKSAIFTCDKDFLDVYGVRITPPFLEFKHAFDGRTYTQKLSIRNISKSKVFIRIKSPTSFAYKIKCGRGYNLSPGLCMVKEVSYIYTHATSIVPSCILAIYINENRYDYHMFAKISLAEITITPKVIDFGLIDAGFTSTMRTMVIQNDGGKAARFYIDCTRTEHQIIIDPNKGTLKPKSSCNVNIKLVSSLVGSLQAELWIKCEKAFIIPVMADVIKPKFEPVDNTTGSFNLVDFPITYVGLTSTQTVYIRNYSATGAMFCLMGEVNSEIMNLKVCKEMEPEFKNFDAYPKEGIYESKEVKALNFKFQPVKPEFNEKLKPFYFCIYHICRIRCKYLMPSEYGTPFAIDNQSLECTPIRNPSLSPEQSTDSDIPVLESTCMIGGSSKTAHECDCVKFYLHGIAEEPSVVIVPDELILSDLQMGQRETRVLELHNQSDTLPIIIAYKKVAYLDVDKNNIFLNPQKSAQIAVHVTPQKIGLVNTQMQFHLMFYDYPKKENSCKIIGKLSVPVIFDVKGHRKLPTPQVNRGITPNYVKEVGKFCENVKFNSPVEKPKTAVILPGITKKDRNATVAFPNDTQRSIRPWRGSTNPKTIFTKLPRYVPPVDTDYELTIFNHLYKMKVCEYYTLYTRKEADRLRSLIKPPRKTASEYDLTNKDKVLCNDIALRMLTHVYLKDQPRGQYFMPLTPMEINDVVVEPAVIHSSPMAPFSKFHFEVNIRNKNSSSIRIFIRSDKMNVTFPEGNRIVIKGFSEASLRVTYSSSTIGYYTASLHVIVNECAVYNVTIFADVFPVTLKICNNRFSFSYDNTHQYVRITNPLNVTTNFRWVLECKNFQIDPLEGAVEANSSLMCHIAYLLNEEGPTMTEAELLAAEKTVKRLKLIVIAASTKLHFVQKELVFKDMPLNIPVIRKAVIKNSFGSPQFFFLMENNFSNFMEVSPSEGIVYGNSYTAITITLTLTNCVNFETTLKFNVARAGVIELLLTGNVVYPHVEISPSLFQFKKVPSSTFEVIKFTVENRSKARAIVRFDMSMYSEYMITESKDYWESKIIEKVVLEKQHSKHLFIHFLPTAQACDKFFLPIIINDILGPVICENLTRKVSYFIRDTIPDSQAIQMPSLLSAIKVQSHSIEPKLCFSRFTINLDYKYSPCRYKNSYRLKICNNQKDVEDVCIRTEDLRPPLYVNYSEGKDIVKHQSSIVCSLSPKEEVVLDILFQPESIGIYQAILPVHLRSDNSTQPHNYLTITGTFASPTIASLTPVIYYKPIPLKVKAVRSIELVFENHFENCRMDCRSDLPGMKIDVLHNTKGFVTIQLHYSTDKAGFFDSTLTVTCRCGVRCVVPLIGSAENCFCTNYAMVSTFIANPIYNLELKKMVSYDTLYKTSYMSVLESAAPLIEEYDMSSFFKDYPLFPADDDDFTSFMNTSVDVMESWVYTQGFFGSTFYKIPEGINNVRFEKLTKPQSCTNTIAVIPFVQLLNNLIGNNFENHFDLSSAPCDEIERVAYCYELYSKVMRFLTGQGAQFSYENPAYLMEYSMYCTYIDHFTSEDVTIKISDSAQFHRLSKQCWLDLLLQTFKALVLHRLIMSGKVCALTKSKCTPHEKYRSSVKNITRNNHLFNTTEVLLLCWLEFQYNDVRNTFWSDNTYLEQREITFFGEDMDDCFVYAAVTLAYCPYLESHFKELCRNPVTPEGLIHNSIKVIQAWNKLNFSIDVTVQELIKPHSLRTVIITVYLFEVLPYMFPLDTLEFEVGLSKQISKHYLIKNQNNFAIAYKVIIYGNGRKCFETDKDFYVVQANKTCNVKITFWAKFIERCECTLILSGECKGYRYAKSQVITLRGKPDVAYMTATIEVAAFLYKGGEVNIDIQSPYMTDAISRIQWMTQRCSDIANFEALTHRDPNKLIISRFHPIQTEIEFDSDGAGVLKGVSLPLSLRRVSVFFYFRNPDVGDFAIEISSLCIQSSLREVLTVEVPGDRSTQMISRRPNSFYLEIPSQNKLAWKIIIEAFLRIRKEDIHFWRKILKTSTGLHILQKMLRFVPTPEDFRLCGPMTFTPIIPKDSKVTMPKSIQVEDECSARSVKVPIEFKDKKSRFKDFCLTLLNNNDLEVRNYYVNFVYMDE